MFEVYKNRNVLKFAQFFVSVFKMMVQMHLVCYTGGIFCTTLGHTHMINLMCNWEINEFAY